ncbi:dtw domain-containing protein 2 [Pitangus sulphuratus]|nr:dtw domain-containing protein 2 [Pitangus sulphuratus]
MKQSQGEEKIMKHRENGVGKALYKNTGVASHLQALLLMGDFNYPDICRRDNTAGHKQSQRFLKRVNDNFLIQVIGEPPRRGAMLDLVFTHREQLLGNVMLQGSLGCSGYETVDFEIVGAVGRACSKLTALDFSILHFSIGHPCLNWRDIDGWTTWWIQNCLDGHMQRDVVNSSLSTWRPVTISVPLGLVLGPVLFNIFAGDMGKGIVCTLSRFADTTKLCGAVDALKRRDVIQRNLDTPEWWACANLMKINRVPHLGHDNLLGTPSGWAEN